MEQRRYGGLNIKYFFSFEKTIIPDSGTMLARNGKKEETKVLLLIGLNISLSDEKLYEDGWWRWLHNITNIFSITELFSLNGFNNKRYLCVLAQ